MKLNIGNPDTNHETNIMDIEVPEKLKKNITTGWQEMDHLFSGDGIMPSTAVLVTGEGGTGKTTMVIQFADQIMKLGKESPDDEYVGGVAIFNGLEESMYQMKRVVDRLGLENGFHVMCEFDVDEMLENVDKIMQSNPTYKNKFPFLFIDSLPCLEQKHDEHKKGRHKSPENQQVEILQKITSWCKTTNGIAFVLGHVNKNGDFAGKQSLKHIIDVHLHLTVDRDWRSENYGERIALLLKNRTGTANLCYPFQVGRNGFHFNPIKGATQK